MSSDHSPKWLLLSAAADEIRSCVSPYSGLLVEERLKSAVVSRVPLLGILEGGGHIEQRFEDQVPPDAHVDVLLNVVRWRAGMLPSGGLRGALTEREWQWHNVMVELAALQALFRAHGWLPPLTMTAPILEGERVEPRASRRKRRGKAVADKALREWYRGHLRKHAEQGKMNSAEVDWQKAKKKFGSRITRTRVRELRAELAPAEWKQRGRRPRSRKSAE